MAAAVAALVLFAWTLRTRAAVDRRSSVTHTVTIEGMRFQPEVLTIEAGDSVVWFNKDLFPHTATSDGRFDSQNIAAGESWRYAFAKAGEFSYVCSLHPTMKGTLRVK